MVQSIVGMVSELSLNEVERLFESIKTACELFKVHPEMFESELIFRWNVGYEYIGYLILLKIDIQMIHLSRLY